MTGKRGSEEAWERESRLFIGSLVDWRGLVEKRSIERAKGDFLCGLCGLGCSYPDISSG